MRKAALVLVSLGFVACGERAQPSSVQRRSLLDSPATESTAYVTPAEWRYHPLRPATLFAQTALPGGEEILAGDRGERWHVDPKAGRAEVASELAPEDLRAIVRLDTGGWLFVGKSGTTYEAESPLGPFVRSNAPLEPFARVRTAGGVLVGVRRDGSLFGSDSGGAVWRPIGPSGQRFEDAMIRADGKGLAIAVPEALFETRDSGATWSRLDVPTFGASLLFRDDKEGIVVLGALGPRRFDPGGARPLVELGAAFSPHAFAVRGSPALGPSATALVEGRAVENGGKYVEVRSDADFASWRIVEGRLGAPLTARPFETARGCTRVWLAAFGDFAYLACTREKGGAGNQTIEVRRSTDGLRTFSLEPYSLEGRSEQISVAVGASGDLIITGICPPASRGPGCRPAGIHRRVVAHGDAGAKVTLETSATPALAGPGLSLAFSPDGRTLHAVGQRSKTDALAAFLSRDGGATFDAHDLDALPTPDDEARARGQEGVTVDSLRTSESGTVSLVVTRSGRRTWVVLDDEGRPVAFVDPPAPTARIGAVGERAFAVDVPSREAWESLDGGATWTPLGKLPIDPCPGLTDCTARVACVRGGCVVGESASRVGFREAPRSGLLAPRSDGATRRTVPKVRAPLVCTLDAGEWRRISGVSTAPSIHTAAFPKTTWFTVRSDPRTAAVSSLRMRPGPHGALDEVRLFDPSRTPERVAFTASVQVEGIAALRYPLPAAGDAEPRLSRVEVAWDDVLAGRTGRAAIADAGPYRSADYSSTGAPSRTATPALVSIAAGGVYVRPHGGEDAQPTYFVDGRTVEVVPPLIWPPTWPRELRGRSEMIHVGAAHVPVRFDGALVLRAFRSDRGFDFDAARLAFAEPDAMGRTQSVSLAYSGDRAGVLVDSASAGGVRAESSLYLLRAAGAVVDDPIPVPTQLDLAAAEKPCTPAERATTPRVVSSYLPGTRHPVIVTDPVEPIRVFLTAGAVLHGTPASPCVASYEARLLSLDAAAPTDAQRESALLPFDALERSFIFRVTPAPGAPPSLEYRGMTCRIDPAAEIPPEVYAEQGTAVVSK